MTRSEKHCEVNRSTSLLEESTRSDAARSSSIDRRNFQIVATVQHLTSSWLGRSPFQKFTWKK